MKPNLKTIANLANVSVSAVSLTLNGKPGVSEATRQRILKIEKQIRQKNNEEYLAKHKSEGTFLFLKIIKHGNILNRDHDIFIADYIEGIENEVSKRGYTLQISTFNKPLIKKNIQIYNNLPVDGLILLGTELLEEDVKLLNTINKPIVFVDTVYNFVNASFVDMSSVDEVFLAIKHLKEMGHTHIGYIRSTSHTQNFIRRDQGFKRVIEYLDLEYDEDIIFNVESTYSGSYRDMKLILEKGAKLPTALFVVNDLIASGCIKAMKEYGIKIPEDVSIVAFDNLPSSAIMEPSLTTINVRKRIIGKKAANFLIDTLNCKEPLPPIKTLISGELVIRDSVKKLY